MRSTASERWPWTCFRQCRNSSELRSELKVDGVARASHELVEQAGEQSAVLQSAQFVDAADLAARCRGEVRTLNGFEFDVDRFTGLALGTATDANWQPAKLDGNLGYFHIQLGICGQLAIHKCAGGDLCLLKLHVGCCIDLAEKQFDGEVARGRQYFQIGFEGA